MEAIFCQVRRVAGGTQSAVIASGWQHPLVRIELVKIKAGVLNADDFTVGS